MVYIQPVIFGKQNGDEYFNEVKELRKDGFYVIYDKEQCAYEVRWDDCYINNKNIEETKEI